MARRLKNISSSILPKPSSSEYLSLSFLFSQKFRLISSFSRSYCTYRAMLAFYYSGVAPFTALPSDYLHFREDRILRAIQGEWLPIPPPAQWFRQQFENLPDQRDYKGVQPCCPHSMYQLADCYGMTELKELARSRIMRSLSSENVSDSLSYSITAPRTKLSS